MHIYIYMDDECVCVCAQTQRGTQNRGTQVARRQVLRRFRVGENASNFVEANRTEAERIVRDAFFDQSTNGLKERLARVKELQSQINEYGITFIDT